MQQPTKPDSFASASISSAPSPSLEPEPGAGRGPRPGHPTGAQVQAICEAMVTTVARVAYDWPGIEHALLDAITSASAAAGSDDEAFTERRYEVGAGYAHQLLGQRVASRTFDRQITELKVRAAILNRFSQIGTPNTVRVS